jgi:hypothetical protein
MTTKNRTKINSLISEWPNGLVYTQSYLNKLGYNSDLVQHYVRSSWIERVGNGAFKKYHDTVDCLGALAAVQQQLGKNIHCGGKTSLSLQGISHYIQLNQETVYLFSPVKENLPEWFLNHKKMWRFEFIRTNFLDYSVKDSFTSFERNEYSFKISSNERALLEILYLIPDRQGFDEAFKLMEMLPSLRPTVMQALLNSCTSVKVNRLFMFMAKRLHYPWFDELETDLIHLGSGKRQIIKNGKLDKEFLITVPEEYVND